MTTLAKRRIGLIEDDPIMGAALAQRLGLEGAAAIWWRSGSEALAALAAAPATPPDALVCDIRLPDLDGEEVFARLARAGVTAPIMFVTGYGDIDQAVRLMRAGAADYLTKPFAMEAFLERLAALSPAERASSEPVLGVSAAMRAIERLLERIAGHPGPVLITGETGVGKEVCAQRLHALSRPGKPFMAVNCAAIPAELLESELFGHERGAFTGAHARHLGYAERAGEGVLFLDEIAETTPSLQVKLLRLIEAREFRRLGGEATLPFRARIVAATHRDLAARVAEGAFREDLLYRLDMFAIEVPPLRSRPDDVEWLLERFLAAAERGSGRTLRGVGALAIEAARAHDWPGNVRELRNRVERAVALALGDRILPADLFPPKRGSAPAAEPGLALAEAREAAERRAIESAFRDCGGHVAEAAQRLGVSRTTLWEKMRRLGLSEPRSKS